MDALVRPSQPPGELGVEVGDGLEAAARQEARLEVAVGPFDQPLRFGVAALAQLSTDAERAAERLELSGEHLLAATPLADRALLVPHHPPRQRPELSEHLEMAAEHVMGLAGRDHPPADQPGEATDPGDHPQLGGLPVPERDLNIGLPQIELGQLTREVVRPLARIRWHEQRAQLAHPVAQHPDRVRPADPLGDHRRRHRRKLPQQLQHRRFHRVDDRPRRRPLIARRTLSPQRCPHRVARQTEAAGDRLDPHPLRPMQPTDLSPLVHVDHSPCLLARLEPGSAFHHIQWWTRHRGSEFACR